MSRDHEPGAAGQLGLRVRGGSAGLAVELDSLDEVAGVLADSAQEAAFMGASAARSAVDVDLVAGGALSPATGALAAAALADVAGPLGLGGEVAALVTLAATVRSATAAYRAGEAAAAVAVQGVHDSVLLVGGLFAPHVVVGVLALDALGVDVAGVLDGVLFDQPEVADLAGGAEGLVLGLRTNPLTAPLVRAPRADGPGGRDGRDRSDAPHAERPAGDNYGQAVAALADSALVWGLLDDRGLAEVTAEPSPRPGARAPRTLRDLAEDQRNVGDGDLYPGHVRVIEVPQPHGSAWVVEISSTQAWDPHAGDTPFDVTTDVRAMAQQTTVLAEGVHQALAQAQAASAGSLPGDSAGEVAAGEQGPPVMLVGHSLGGITAAGLASSPAFVAAHRVTHVVTMGAPVGRIPVPVDTQVLSLEHTRDPVPRLEGKPNPDRPSWVTVTRDAHAPGVDRASQTHDLRGYVETAGLVDTSTDASVAGWRTTSAAFFDGGTHGEPVIRDYAIRRVRP